ncbi:hypothetical protein QN277_016190 [Acacia crassicarpa]|uniref:Uncharacterized protein n=1 Tax=Acacia crassicarpa TaxID=499986 RepID=A0AAE1TB68_9FABA|nr:hypothetical protein QN277_016190 [Acacia crassicarpa]
MANSQKAQILERHQTLMEITCCWLQRHQTLIEAPN